MLADIAHKSIVIGLLGVTAYYTMFVAGTSATVVEKYKANKAAKESKPNSD